jgi:ankyrin repeat protein
MEVHDDSLDRQLLVAATLGKTFRCLELLDANACIDARSDGDFFTPLMLAAWGQHHDTAMALLEAKASVHVSDKFQRTCLHEAALRGNVPLCRAMLAHNADIDAVAINNETPLFKAVFRNRANACTFLLNAGANVDAVALNGKTAWQRVIRSHRTDAAAAIQSWLKDRDAARAFARGTMHARLTHKSGDWTDSKLFDKHLIGEITAFVSPRAASRVVCST